LAIRRSTVRQQRQTATAAPHTTNTFTITPYVVDLTRTPKGTWRIQHLAFQNPNAFNG